MNELTKEWVDKAEADFYSADLLLHAGEYPLPEPACFHCQQCAEKYLSLSWAWVYDPARCFDRRSPQYNHGMERYRLKLGVGL